MDWTTVRGGCDWHTCEELTDLHLGDIRVGRGVSTVGFRKLGLSLAQVLAGGVEGSVGHCDGRCGLQRRRRMGVDMVDEEFKMRRRGRD